MTEGEYLSADLPALMDYLMAQKYDDPPAADDGWKFGNRQGRLFAAAAARSTLVANRRKSNGPAQDNSLAQVIAAERIADGVAWGKWAERLSRQTPCLTASYAACLEDPMVRFWRLSHDLAGGADILRDTVRAPMRPAFWLDDPKMHAQAAGRPYHPSQGPHLPLRQAWRTRDVVRLAQAAYHERNADGSLDELCLAAIADAIEEAGAGGSEMVWKLRGFGRCPHCVDFRVVLEAANRAGGAADVTCSECDGGWVREAWPRWRGFWPLEALFGRA